MRSSPFIDGSARQRERERARRRRRRAGAALATLGLLVATAAIVLALGVGRAGEGTGAGARAARPTTVLAPAGRHRQLSAVGLPLGVPPLRLRVSDAAAVTPHFGRQEPRAGVLFNLRTGRVLWQRAALTRVRIASLTKMMTALLAVEHAPPDDPVRITREAVHFQGSGVGLLPYGRRVPLEALLAGLLLPSGNDAAIALAQHVRGNVSAFVALMNARAAQLGLGCTRYSSPSGFYDRANYSCAADLAVLAAVDLGQPRIERLSSRAAVTLPFPIKGGRLYLSNNNPLVLEHYPGITGLKTGYTAAAGACLVATARRGGVSLGVVLLDSPNPGSQARQLLDAGYRSVYHQSVGLPAAGSRARS